MTFTRSYAPLAGVVVTSAALSASYALRATHWAVMTDELQTIELAAGIAGSFSPLPSVHGAAYGPASQLYPLLLAPLVGAFPTTTAVDAAHLLNAALFASAAVPAFLLGRAVTGSRTGGLFAAALTAFTPWLVLTTTLLTENAAYPAFAWGVFLAHRTMVAPSHGRDVAALAGIAAAFFARTQLIVLAGVVPTAIVVHELARAWSSAPRGTRVRALAIGARSAASLHPLLAAAVLAGGALFAVGSLGGLFGHYRDVVSGDLLPSGVGRAAAEHLAYVVVGTGVAPFLLAGAWAIAAGSRPGAREAHAFAVLLVILVPLLVLQAASFDVRFAPGGFVQDRYLAYLAPLFAVGAAAALLDRERRARRAVLVAGFGVAFTAVATLPTFPATEQIFWAAPASAFHEALADAGRSAGWETGSLVRAGVLVLAAVLAAAVWRAPCVVALATTGAAVVAFSVTEVVYVFQHAALPVTVQEDTIPNADRDWVDDFLPEGASVALVPYAYLPPDVWWDADFWNVSVDRVLEIYGPTFNPFPVERVSLDLATGRVQGLPAGDLLLVALEDTRLRLAGTTTVLTAPPLNLVRIRRPARAEWSTRGAEPDGWSRPGRPVYLRFYEAGAPGLRDLRVTLRAATETASALPFRLSAPGVTRLGRVAADAVRAARLTVCVPKGGYGEATLVTPRGVRIRDGRVVGLHLDGVEATATGRACRR